MRIVSLRWFRQDVAAITEPVQVVRGRRGSRSEIELLGTWVPATHSKPLRLTIEGDGSISAIAGGPLEKPISTGPTRPFTPAPKPHR